MCLKSDKGVPMVANDPIICYKVLKTVHNPITKEDRYETPVQHHVVEKDVLEGRVEMVAEGRADVTERGRFDTGNMIITDGYNIGGGFIHCFTSEDLARYVAFRKSANEEMSDVYYVVFQCEIPEGIEYFVSSDSYHYEVCAKKIRFVGSRYIY